MARVLLLCVFLSLQILQCLSQEVDGDLGDGKIFNPNTATLVNYTYASASDECCSKCQALKPDARFFAFSKEVLFCACFTTIDGVTPVSMDPTPRLKDWIRKPVDGVCVEVSEPAISVEEKSESDASADSGNGPDAEALTITTTTVKPEQDPSVGEYFLEAVDLANRTRWRYFLPEDTDIDQDGNLSDLEVQHKFNIYMGEVFKLIDHDKDNSITEEEFRSLKLDIPHLTKAVDIALENFPLRPFFLAADGNGDGVYDEHDFYMPEKKDPRNNRRNPIETQISIRYKNKVDHGGGVGVVKIGQNEGTVICKSLGYDGLERVVEADEIGYLVDNAVAAYSCDGTEAVLEDCQAVDIDQRIEEKGMGVVCQGGDKLGALHLVGGKDAASGDILLGKKGLTCHPWHYKHKNSEVICRELGYSGLVRYTEESAFTNTYFGDNQKMGQQFYCNGKEERLADCEVRNAKCYDGSLDGVICATDGKTGINQDLSELIEWPRTARVWEENGRFLFIADANGDGKLTLEELATKGKELMTKILEFLDENQDGKISLEDINLHLSLGPIQNLVLELFDDVTAGKGEFDVYNIEIAGQDMSKFDIGIKGADNNGDEKINAADLFGYLNSREKATFLLPMASVKIDKNQDGKIQREELRQIIDEMFNQLDEDKNGALTLEDVYILLRENGLDCFQVGALRSYIKVFLDTIDTETRNFFGYLFHQFDTDGNGQISSTELEQMHVPCDTSGRYRYRDYDYNSNEDSDPNAKKACEMMFDGFKIGELIRSFPDSIFSERHGRGKRWGGEGHGSGRGGRGEARKETLVDKLTNRACEMLT